MPVLGEYRRLFVGLAPHLCHMRMPGDRFEIRIDAKRPDGRGEAFEIGKLHGLVGKVEYLMPEPRGADIVDVAGRKLCRQIDSANLGPARRCVRRHFNGHMSRPSPRCQ